MTLASHSDERYDVLSRLVLWLGEASDSLDEESLQPSGESTDPSQILVLEGTKKSSWTGR